MASFEVCECPIDFQSLQTDRMTQSNCILRLFLATLATSPKETVGPLWIDLYFDLLTIFIENMVCKNVKREIRIMKERKMPVCSIEGQSFGFIR